MLHEAFLAPSLRMKDIILPEQLRIPCFLENVSDSDHEWAGARRGFRFLLGTRSSIAHIHVGMYSFGPGGCCFSSDQALRSTELYDTVPEGARNGQHNSKSVRNALISTFAVSERIVLFHIAFLRSLRTPEFVVVRNCQIWLQAQYRDRQKGVAVS